MMPTKPIGPPMETAAPVASEPEKNATRWARRTSMPRVAVIGAGAFGGWTALELRRRGAQVTLIDAWGPGNARASSGGETRVIRATYMNQPPGDLSSLEDPQSLDAIRQAK